MCQTEHIKCNKKSIEKIVLYLILFQIPVKIFINHHLNKSLQVNFQLTNFYNYFLKFKIHIFLTHAILKHITYEKHNC